MTNATFKLQAALGESKCQQWNSSILVLAAVILYSAIHDGKEFTGFVPTVIRKCQSWSINLTLGKTRAVVVRKATIRPIPQRLKQPA